MIIITAIIPYLIYGAIGGNVVGLLDKRKKLGFWKDTLIGAFGGFAIGFALNTAINVIPSLSWMSSILFSSGSGFTNGLSILWSFLLSIAPGGIAVFLVDSIKKL